MWHLTFLLFLSVPALALSTGQKFAVASGYKCVPVCHFEPEHDWWVSDQIKKHKSTVLSTAWHPNSQLIATASTDFKCRIFNAFIEGVDAV